MPPIGRSRTRYDSRASHGGDLEAMRTESTPQAPARAVCTRTLIALAAASCTLLAVANNTFAQTTTGGTFVPRGTSGTGTGAGTTGTGASKTGSTGYAPQSVPRAQWSDRPTSISVPPHSSRNRRPSYRWTGSEWTGSEWAGFGRQSFWRSSHRRTVFQWTSAGGAGEFELGGRWQRTDADATRAADIAAAGNGAGTGSSVDSPAARA